MSDDIRKRVDKATAGALAEGTPRGHLGASQLGNACLRASWYAFRWAYQKQHTGRIQRLFDRGHSEEHRLYRWMRMAGFEVRDYTERLVYHPGSDSYATMPWDQDFHVVDDLDDVSHSEHHIALALEQGVPLKQWGFVDHDGHFAGSSDGKIKFPADFKMTGQAVPEGWGGVECKTHGDKSFSLLQKKGVVSSKPVHAVQMQIYMHYLQLPWTLYIAVNKNTDDLYFEIMYYKPELCEQYSDVARKLIQAQQPPNRYSNDPSWFECKFCDFREICHYDAAPQVNCRSCAFAEPGPDATWYCKQHHGDIPPDFIPQACPRWEPVC